MTFRKIASVRNGSEVICEVKAELRDSSGKLRDVVIGFGIREKDRKGGDRV
jgi:hypothetical protein